MESPYLTLKEAAEYLRMSYQTLYRLTRNNQISIHKPAGKVLFTISDLDNYMAKGRVASKYEMMEKTMNKVHKSVFKNIRRTR